MKSLPLAGLRVIEFSQMVMGPCCGLMLADLGAEVIKIEPLPRGDRTRYLPGLAAGFFAAFNRNKKSVAVDMKSEKGLALVKQFIAKSDIVIENFKPGMMDGFGLGYSVLAKLNPRLIFCSLKGFLPGPYEHRTALDEMVQMMGGLAFMTGLPGRPMRAGASVNDIMGAMFGVIAIQGAVRVREATGQGQEVQAALFENNVFLMAQAMLAEAITGEGSEPWSVKERPWPVYDLFMTSDGIQIFFGIIGDGQWKDFCNEFGKPAWLADPRLQTNADRSAARSWILPVITDMIRSHTVGELISIFERLAIPFAPVRRPGDLKDDPHLNASGGLLEIMLPNGKLAKVPTMPITFNNERIRPERGIPAVGVDTRSVLRDFGLSEQEVETLWRSNTVADRVTSPVKKEVAEVGG
jgi:crotonobetainyl-CoA:carnitine CoA-transferase CaiB-like acyl-CoA transferase